MWDGKGDDNHDGVHANLDERICTRRFGVAVTVRIRFRTGGL